MIGASALVAVIAATVAAIGVFGGGGDDQRVTVHDSGGGGGGQDAGLPGDDAPPGVPTVTATRIDAAHLRFTWTYSAPLASDTFAWRTEDGKSSGTAKTATVDLPDRAGVRLCVQVKVVRADGSH